MSHHTTNLSPSIRTVAGIGRMPAFAILLALVLQLVGCGSPFVGRWKSEQFQPPNPELQGPGMLMVHIKDDQTFVATYESKDKAVKRGATGRWDQESNDSLRLFIKNGDGPEMTQASLESKNTLLLIGKGFAEKLKRD